MEMDAFKEIELKWTALVREIGWFQVLLKHGEMIKEWDGEESRTQMFLDRVLWRRPACLHCCLIKAEISQLDKQMLNKVVSKKKYFFLQKCMCAGGEIALLAKLHRILSENPHIPDERLFERNDNWCYFILRFLIIFERFV